MDYQRIYDQLTESCQSRIETEGYTEVHHILPKSMGGGDGPENLVCLTGREHFIAHRLLEKIHNNSAMTHALWAMSNGFNGRLDASSRVYEYSRKKLSEAMTGVTLSRERKDNMSKAKMGVPLSQEHKDSISAFWTDERKAEVGPHSQEHKDNISKGKMGVKQPKATCPHCGLVGGKMNMTRWHFDNCKQKESERIIKNIKSSL